MFVGRLCNAGRDDKSPDVYEPWLTNIRDVEFLCHLVTSQQNQNLAHHDAWVLSIGSLS